MSTISVIDELGCVVPSAGVEIIRPRSMGKSTVVQMVFNRATTTRVFEHTFVKDDKIKPSKQRRASKQRLKGLRP